MSVTPQQQDFGDRGDTLIEVLVAVVIIGLTVTALLGMILTTATSSESHRSTASFDAALVNFAEVARNAIVLQASNGSSTTPKFTACSTGYTLVGNPIPSSGPPGTVVTVLGTGFTPVTVSGIKEFSGAKFNGSSVGFTSYASTSSVAAGDIAQFTIPSGTPAGSYQVDPFDGANAAPTKFTVTSTSLPSQAETVGADALTYDTFTATISYWNAGWTSNTANCSGTNYNANIQQMQLSLVDSAPKNGASSSQSFELTNLSPQGGSSPPVTLTASSPAARELKLSWFASSFTGSGALLHYNLYRSTTSGGPWGTAVNVPLTDCTSGSCSYTDTTTTSDNTLYYYEVTAVTTVGESQASNQATGTTLPGATTGLTLSAPSTGNILLSWTAPSGGNATITGYNVYCSTTAGTQGPEVTNVTSTSYTDSACAGSPLGNDNHYYYEVAAVNAGGLGTASAQATGTTLAAAPTGVSATALSNSVRISWTAATAGTAGITGYNVYCSTTSGTQGAKVNTAVISASPYTATTCSGSAISAGTYYFEVTTVNSAGETASTQVSATLGGPSAPTGLAANPGHSGNSYHVTLTWAAASPNGGSAVQYYNVYRSQTASMPSSPYQSNVAALTYTDNSVSHNDTWYYWVTAVNADNVEGPAAATGQVKVN